MSDAAHDLNEAYRAEIAETAGTSNSPNKKYRYRLDKAAEIIAERCGVPFSSESLRKSDVPRILVWGRFLFCDEDLHRFADERLNLAALHHGPRPRSALARNARAGKTPAPKRPHTEGGCNV